MNKELSEVLKMYSTESHEKFTSRLVNQSKETLISIFTDLLTTYINDHNSSKLREYLTVTIAGYEYSEAKIGFNGFKQSSIVGGEPVACEAKPKNFNTTDLQEYREGKRKSKPPVLNGGGNFTDYTYPRLKRDRKENPHMLVSGFVDGRLIYVLEFPFKVKSFTAKLSKQLFKQFPDRTHIKGRFLRSASFNFRDYIFSKELRSIYVLNKLELDVVAPYINKKLLQFLNEKAK